jgi:hypothetical protein
MWWLAAVAAAQDAEPLDRYLAARLDVVESDVTTVYARAYDGSGRFWFVVDHDGRALDTIAFATRIGDDSVADAIRRRRRAEQRGGVVLALVGVAAAGVGIAAGPGDFLLLAPAGVAGSVGGAWLVGRSLGRSHPSAAYTEDEARERVDAYNGALRDQILGP